MILRCLERPPSIYDGSCSISNSDSAERHFHQDRKASDKNDAVLCRRVSSSMQLHGEEDKASILTSSDQMPTGREDTLTEGFS